MDKFCPNCGRTNQGNFCPSCGTARDAQPTTGAAVQVDGGMTLDQRLIPVHVIELINRCIEAACAGIAAD